MNNVQMMSFDEFVQYGREHAAHCVDGDPASFVFRGRDVIRIPDCTVTRRDDEFVEESLCDYYVIGGNKERDNVYLRTGDTLLVIDDQFIIVSPETIDRLRDILVPPCGATVKIDDTTFVCGLNKGHKGRHGCVDGPASVTWEIDEREQCCICGALDSDLFMCSECCRLLCDNCAVRSGPHSILALARCPDDSSEECYAEHKRRRIEIAEYEAYGIDRSSPYYKFLTKSEPPQ